MISHLRRLLLIWFATLMLAGCSQPTPTPALPTASASAIASPTGTASPSGTATTVAAIPTHTPGASATASPTGTVSPAGTATVPAGWLKRETANLVIWLPANWEALEVTQTDAETLFGDFQKRNPDHAKVIGNAQALQGVSLWAFNTRSAEPGPWTGQGGLVDNLNIRRTPLGGQTPTVQSVLDAIVSQYRQLGFTVHQSAADLRIGGRPAGRIEYNFPVTAANGQQISAEGVQYLAISDTALWVLSFTAGPGQKAILASVFEASALSFQEKPNP